MNQQLMEQKRDYVLDLIRTVAIILVVFNHAFEQVYDMTAEVMGAASQSVRILAFTGFTLGRLGVPLFMMLSGYLLLTRTYDSKGILKFYKKNLLPLVITWEIWVLLYNLFLWLYNGIAFSFITYLKQAFFILKINLPHTWYAPTIIGIYLFIPLVAKVLQTLDKKLIFILAAIVFVYFFIVPSINLLKEAQTQLNLYYSGGIYGLYLTAGYYLKTHPVKASKASRWVLLILGICVLFAAIVFIQLYLCQKGQFYKVWYDFVLFPPFGLLVFILFLQKKKKVLPAVFYRIAIAAFGIFLIHELFMLPLIDLLGTSLPKIIEVLIAGIGSFLLSYVVIELISLIPKAGKILFLRKQ